MKLTKLRSLLVALLAILALASWNRVHFICFIILQMVEFTKLMSLLAALLTTLALAAYIALSLAWSLRKVDCSGKILAPFRHLQCCTLFCVVGIERWRLFALTA